MCGIFGWSLRDNTLNKYQRRVLFDILSIQNDSRGGQSWGTYSLDRSGKYSLEHGLGDIYDSDYPEVARPWDSNVVFAHTRMATHGEKIVANAHPFHIGSVIGAHNGVLNNHFELNRTHDRTFAVDSQHIFAHIDAGLALDDLEGYGAIEYVHTDKPGNVFLGTFNHYLCVYRLKDGAGILWSSDDKHAKHAMRLMRLSGETIKMEDEKLYEVYDCEIFETTGSLKVKKPISKYDWRQGQAGNGSSGGYCGRNTTVYHPQYQTQSHLPSGNSGGGEKPSDESKSGSQQNSSTTPSGGGRTPAEDTDWYKVCPTCKYVKRYCKCPPEDKPIPQEITTYCGDCGLEFYDACECNDDIVALEGACETCGFDLDAKECVCNFEYLDCDECGGSGRLIAGPDAVEPTKRCHGCKGEGVILIKATHEYLAAYRDFIGDSKK